MAKLDPSNLKAGDMLYSPTAPVTRYAIVESVGPHRGQRTFLDLTAFKHARDGRWFKSSGGTELFYFTRVVTGDEADRLHAEYAAAVLLGEC